MMCLGHLTLLLIAALVQDAALLDRSKIEIINTGKYIPVGQTTNFDAGPVVGNMLNAHYFPGLNLYNGGRYKEAEQEFTYVVSRPSYLDANPRRAEFLSTSYYLRGMIYFYHAKGLGHQSIAKEDFEAALKFNPRNYVVYLELSRLYSGLGFQEQAATILRHLLDLKPEDEEIVEQAQKALDTITPKASSQN
jgi:tetratricopeptide (TPR) repeat protein